ncbi:TonB family protein [Caulobacter sp. SLTY]|uniref:TonB family protein n=1 Tax=Caulobacter sp. SLTY TaxID=2683262 RepID=UPI001413304D|nr:TonB family protein [Caulobacter sp. SLTY]NBB15522.1 TonB family protein [Caulobacter sp. SLTY]
MLVTVLLVSLLGGQDPPVPISPLTADQVPKTLAPAPPVVDPAVPPKVVQRPAWARRPTGEQVNRVYPDLAFRLAIPGRTVLTCKVRDTGLVDGCEVVEETPADMGFGEAGLRLSSGFRMTPQLQDGVPVDGATVRIPLSFSAPPGDSLQAEVTYEQALTCVSWHSARLLFLPKDPESTRALPEAEALARQTGVGLDQAAVRAAIAGARITRRDDERLATLPPAPDVCRTAA